MITSGACKFFFLVPLTIWEGQSHNSFCPIVLWRLSLNVNISYRDTKFQLFMNIGTQACCKVWKAGGRGRVIHEGQKSGGRRAVRARTKSGGGGPAPPLPTCPRVSHCIEFRARLISITSVVYCCEWVRHFQSYFMHLSAISVTTNSLPIFNFLDDQKSCLQHGLLVRKFKLQLLNYILTRCILRHIFNSQGTVREKSSILLKCAKYIGIHIFRIFFYIGTNYKVD